MKRLTFLLFAVLPLLFAAVLYSNGVRLPFFSDDIATQRYVTRTPLLDLWTQVEVNGTYYRPLSNLLHKTIPLSAPLWHSVMLWLHLLSVALVGALAAQLRLSRRGVVVAMLVYAVFPFHAQAVLWAASIVHVLLTVLVLLAAVAALRSLTQRRWTLIAVLAGMAAPFAHESGVVAALLIGLVLWARLGTHDLWHTRRHVIGILLPVFVAALCYWLLRSHIVGGSGFALEAERAWRNGAFFAQGFSLPTQVIAAALDGDAVLRAWLAFAILAGLVSPLLWRTRRLALAMSAWAVIALAPAVLLLHPSYVLYGERLMTLGVPTIALLAGLLAQRGRLWMALWIVPFVALCVVLAGDTMRLHHLHGDAFRPMFDQVNLLADDTRLLFLNLPSQTERARSPLPLWRANAGLLTDWINLNDFLWLNLNQREFTQVAYARVPELDPTLPDLPTNFYGSDTPLADLPRLLAASDLVFQAFAVRDHWQILTVAQRIAPLTTGALFAESIRLGASSAVVQTDYVAVTLDWTRERRPDQPYTVYVHVLCDGNLIGQADGDPFSNSKAFSAWQDDEAWRETRLIVLPADVPSSCLQVRVGLYNRETQIRTAYRISDVTDNAGILIQVSDGK